MLWYQPDALDVEEELGARVYMPFAGIINRARAFLKVEPTGSNVIIDVNKNGTSVFGATKLIVLDGENLGVSEAFETATFSAGDYLTVDVDQIGSGDAGEKLTVSLEITTL
jgi:hypothetical protein